ncbi:hypothetical protein ACERK3_07530 [Phycisphaerales bacterium AB-hyl4]|uniref:Uncharacterized protein n=1 Tax=Natronomicrosphaera hydrolytica TaxID=3242702 RepID=A0ABV4U4A2_9BACT
MDRYAFAFAVSLLLTAASMPALADQPAWRALVVPASLDDDETIHWVADHGQAVSVVLQALDEIAQSASEHELSITLSLPPGTEFLGGDGSWQFQEEPVTQTVDGRPHVRMRFLIPSNRIQGEPGDRAGSEWMSQTLFVRAPEQIDPTDAFVRIELEHERATTRANLPVEMHVLDEPGVQPEGLRLGLWTYAHSRKNERSAAAMTDFLKTVGVNYLQEADDTLYKAMRSNGITSGGKSHHGVLSDPELKAVAPSGETIDNFNAPVDDFRVVRRFAPSETPGVAELVATARRQDGIASLNLEPTQLAGFHPDAIDAFLERADISPEQFDAFRTTLAEHGRRAHLKITSPEFQHAHDEWVAFRSDVASKYVAHLAEGFRAEMPDGRFELCVNQGFAGDPPTMRGYGYDAAALARHTDAILPQLYYGYGPANAKRSLLMARAWVRELAEQQIEADFIPLVLKRYAGASVKNTAEQLTQHLIGMIAEGAAGAVIYYPEVMDARDWIKVAEVSRQFDKYGSFYREGTRVDDRFAPAHMPTGSEEVSGYPGYTIRVDNPTWHFTAHHLNGKTLLTLFNLKEEQPLKFHIPESEGQTVAASEGVKPAKGGRFVGPRQVGFVVLEQSE